MKLKIDWKALGRMIWDAVKPDVDASVVPKCPRPPRVCRYYHPTT